MSIFRPISVVCVVPFLYLLPTMAMAENTNINTTSEDAINSSMPTTTLDTITITARGVVENQLETPFVVDTISSSDIENGHMVTAEDAVRSNPSVDVHNGGNVAYSLLWMRGTGSLSMTSLDDNSVDFRIDNISNGKTGLARNLVDVESVEIAKGPQGTLLGSKAEAGSIAIRTNEPVDYFEGNVAVGAGSHNQKSAEAVVNVPLSDNVAVRVAGMTEIQDNQIIKADDDEPLNEKEKQGIQAKIRWHDDTDSQEAILSVYHDKQTNNVPVLQKDFDTFEVATFGLKHESENVAQGATLSIKSDVNFADVQYTVGYHNYTGDIQRPYLPPEMLPLQYAMFRIPAPMQAPLNMVFAKGINNRQRLQDDVTQVSQELRLVSKPDSKAKWVAGMYYEQKERDWYNDGKVSLSELPDSPVKGFLTATGSNGDTHKSFNNNSKAIFGELTYPVMDNLDVVAGARVTNEKLVHISNWEGNTNNALATSVKSANKTLEETATTGRFGLSYAINPQWRVYGLQSRGHKFGGFADYENNLIYDNPLTYYKPTTIDASEIGTKYQTADKSLNLGLALYQNDMKDDHISVIGTPPQYLSQTANVDSRSRGAELSADWKVTDNWQLNANLAYTDATVTNADNVPDPQVPGQLKLTEKGNRMPQVPEYSGDLGVSYSNDISLLKNGQWFANANYRYVGARYGQAFNAVEMDAYGLVNASVGIANDSHELSIWGKNLTDENYLYISAQPANVGSVAPERTYGVKYGYYF